MNTYTFTFTLEQVNEIVGCMNKGPFDLVTKCLNEFRRQMQAQEKKDELPDQAAGAPGNAHAQPTQQ